MSVTRQDLNTFLGAVGVMIGTTGTGLAAAKWRNEIMTDRRVML